MLNFLGLKKLFSGIKSRDLETHVTTEGKGDTLHEHRFEEVPCDRDRFGPSTTDFDKDYGTALEFPMCTYKTLLRCACGEERVHSIRSLI